MVSPLLLGVLFFVAMLAGFIDSIAGGGGLLTIPALMAAGMSPANALATNKLQACGGSISATIYFIRRKVVSLSDQTRQPPDRTGCRYLPATAENTLDLRATLASASVRFGFPRR